MKTIKWLNEHWWYRLVKVVYLFLMISIFGIVVFVNTQQVGEYRDDSKVVCNYGNKSTFLAYKDKGIYVYYDFSTLRSKLQSVLTNDTAEALQNACGISKAEMDSKQNDIFNGTDNGMRLFDVTSEKVITFTYTSAFLWSLLSLVIILLVAEIIKRIFYYIVLGSVRPNKE